MDRDGDCVVIGRWLVLTRPAGLFPAMRRAILYRRGARSDTYIVHHKSWRGVKMPVKVHAAHVHFMLECPAPVSGDECVCVCIDDV